MIKDELNSTQKQNTSIINMLYIVMVSLYFFGYQSNLRNYIFIISLIIWCVIFKLIKSNHSLSDTLISLLVFSIPISYISVFGGNEVAYVNWFNILSFIFLGMIVITLFTNRNQLISMIKSVNYIYYLLIVLWGIVFILNNSGSQSARNSFLIIMFYLVLLLAVLISKTKLQIDYMYIKKNYINTVMITSIFLILQYILYKVFHLEIGRIEIYGSNRIAFGLINFDFSFLSLFLLSSIFFYVDKVYRKKKINYTSIIGIIILVLASAITTARTGMMALAITVIIYVFINILANNNRFTKKSKTLIITVISVFMLVSLYLVIGSRGLNGSGRMQGYIVALQAFMDNIFIGNGLDYLSLGVKPHNLIIQLLSQMGILVTSITIISIVLLLRDILHKNKPLFYNLLLIIIGSMFIPDILVSKFFNVLLIIGVLQVNEVDSENLKVAHIMSTGGYSGAEKVAISFIESSGENIESYYISVNGPIENILADKEIKHIQLNNSSIRELKYKVDITNTDVVYAHDFKASLLSALLFPNKTVISHIHQNPTWFAKVNAKSILYLVASFFISEIIYVSKETEDTFVFKSIIRNKTRVMHNYVNKDEIENLSLEKVDSGVFDLAYLGRFEDVKDPIKFVEIVSNLNENRKINAVMIGDGSLMNDVQILINDLNLESVITLMGYQSNPFSILNKSRISVITSKWEGFGLSAVEAMILGKPVVATNVGGLKEILKDGGGFLCDSDQMFVDSIEKIMTGENYTELSELAKLSSQKFTDKLSWEENIKEIFEDIR